VRRYCGERGGLAGIHGFNARHHLSALLVVGLKPGHDGAIAAIRDRELLLSLESEKDTFPRYTTLTPMTILSAIERMGEVPDVISLGGWYKPDFLGRSSIGAGYSGAQAVTERSIAFGGKTLKLFSSSHVRSHIWMGAGMAPRDEAPLRAVLVWEGVEGTFYLLDEQWKIVREIPAMTWPGDRYAFLFAIADPTFPDARPNPRLDDSGKLMALAAFGDPADAGADVVEVVDRLLAEPYPAPKANFRDLVVYNAGVEAEVTKVAAALITERIFGVFSRIALEQIPSGMPLYISGGCGLNCDWNAAWRDLGHFSSVFVPPCTNDSGSALGHAIDALAAATGDPHIDWDVYCGLEFERDSEPEPTRWQRRPLDLDAAAEALSTGRIFAWVQGRWEMGPRALGNRSILAEPFTSQTRDRLNKIKRREDYRPIAPCCRIEDAAEAFDAGFPDPYMLYFRRVRSPDLKAVTHVDGSARVQTVTAEGNRPLHELLSAFAARRGVGVLCNTSLNFKGFGFINCMSDLVKYCQARGIDDMVVGDTWYQRPDA
jgi:hydroxymethyl cephem carbamoyltransferase